MIAGREAPSRQRAVPHNIEAEASILGAMTLSLDAAATALHGLKAPSFHKLEHQEIFTALAELFDRNHVGDSVSLVEHLNKKGRLDAAGGPALITQIIGSVVTTSRLEQHIAIVQEKQVLRQLLQTGESIVQECFSGEADVLELLDRSEKKIFELARTRSMRDFVPIKDEIKSSIEKAEQLYSLKSQLTGIGSGYPKLDEKTSGFQSSDMIVLAARPSMGKTALALNIMEHVALVQKKPVGLFSLEMSKEQVVFRMLCSNAGVGPQKLRSGFAGKDALPKLVTAAGRLAESPIYIDDTPGITLMELRGKARRLKARTDCALLIVDYLQLMTSGLGRQDGRQQEISDISRSIKELARELNVPIIILSQLNRAVEARTDHRPMLSDLRESGAIEQDADVVMLLMRREYYDENDQPGVAELNVAKQRNGPTGEIRLHFNKDITRFGSLDPREDEAQEAREETDAPYY